MCVRVCARANVFFSDEYRSKYFPLLFKYHSIENDTKASEEFIRGNTELLHLAESITAAELWIAREGYRNARLEIVGTEDGERAGGADLAA